MKPSPASLIPIRAAVLRGPGARLKIERLEMEPPREDEALARLVASGICHTDISFCEGGVSFPAVLGHEGAGIVEAVGKKVRGFKPGDHVVLSYQSCGRCRACRAGHPVDCGQFWEANFGFARLDGTNALQGGVRGHFFGQSSFATHTLATVRNMVKVPRTLPLAMLAPLGCGLQTGAGTVLNTLAVRARSSIAIFGAGSVGLAAVMAARIAKAAPIIAVDTNRRRLRLARELGATHLIDNSRGDLAESIRAITGAGVDSIVESTADGEMERLAAELLNPGGKAALLSGASAPSRLPGGRKVKSVIQGDAVPQRFIPKLIRLYQAGRFPFDRLLKYYPFGKINRAIADSKRGTTVKPVLLIGEEPPIRK
ncbi:MAG: NAD(P)-dependent alcohol dehydrogenase [Chthoniobacteraceae bacterium]|nr:NAD(P)-dependent alcohol dehydrogenase [Chthoniobacteraceae bacterium]